MRKISLFEGGLFMILFLVLVLTLLILVVVSAVILTIGGSAFLLIFGDVIVCISIIVCIIRHFIKKKK